MVTEYEAAAQSRCMRLNEQFAALGLYTHEQRDTFEDQNSSWLIAPEPFVIERSLYEKIEALGSQLLEFYRVANQMYHRSVRGSLPVWVREYLEIGKSEMVLDYGRMRRFRNDVPFVIRPDIIVTDNGFVITELDSVPGGIGILGALSHCYADLGFSIIGGRDGMVTGFMDGIKSLSLGNEPVLAIVVSEESESYMNEMKWLGEALSSKDMIVAVLRPEELEFTEDGLYADIDHKRTRITVLYRFFELFDLKNIPKIDLMLYAVRKEMLKVTPPLKSYLEEKLLFALFHHPVLRAYFRTELGSEIFESLERVLPKTWIMDPRPLPPHSVIPDLEISGKAVASWSDLMKCTKKEREFVIKPSGYSELAWGSRGLSVGHDLSNEDWSEALENALDSFEATPYVLQEFHKGSRVGIRYYSFEDDTVKRMSGRVRLCPYYFVSGTDVRLSGILATICPLNKKAIHGMTDAVMVPTMVV